MATIGAIKPSKEEAYESKKLNNHIFFGVFFDGTGNNMVQKEDAKRFRDQIEYNGLPYNQGLNSCGANDLPQKENEKGTKRLLDVSDKSIESAKIGSGYSNVAILHSVYRSMSEEEYSEKKKSAKIYRFNIYVEGAGKEAINNDSFWQDSTNFLGSGFGKGDTGVVALVSKAVRMVTDIVNGFNSKSTELHFDVFGFSRGATCARLFSFLVARDSNQKLECEKDFEHFDASSLYNNGKLHFLENFKIKTVDFLGLYDTVSSIGITYDNNVNDFGLYSPNLPNVKATFHICASDEFREHFALTDIGNAVKNGKNAEIFIPGCHSDVGGGYMLAKDDFLIKCPTRIYTENPQTSEGTTAALTVTKEIETVNTLLMLGWIKSSEEATFNIKSIKIHRKPIYGGYSNIPLKMMAIRTKKGTGLEKFSEFPDGRFDIPTECKEISEEMLEIAKKRTGRVWYYPEGKYSSTTYKALRSSFLHFSASETAIKGIVHAPSKKGDVICRIVYKGDKDNSRPVYMCDYK